MGLLFRFNVHPARVLSAMCAVSTCKKSISNLESFLCPSAWTSAGTWHATASTSSPCPWISRRAGVRHGCGKRIVGQSGSLASVCALQTGTVHKLSCAPPAKLGRVRLGDVGKCTWSMVCVWIWFEFNVQCGCMSLRTHDTVPAAQP